jgi:hypothetical protein
MFAIAALKTARSARRLTRLTILPQACPKRNPALLPLSFCPGPGARLLLPDGFSKPGRARKVGGGASAPCIFLSTSSSSKICGSSEALFEGVAATGALRAFLGIAQHFSTSRAPLNPSPQKCLCRTWAAKVAALTKAVFRTISQLSNQNAYGGCPTNLVHYGLGGGRGLARSNEGGAIHCAQP